MTSTPGPSSTIDDVRRGTGTIDLSYLKQLEERTTKRSMDIIGDVIDEIALEGLDGITLQGLWIRLEHRPGFTLDTSTEYKNFIWSSVRRSFGIQVFELPEPRADLVIYDRNNYKDDRGNLIEPLGLADDIYTYNPIDDKKTHIRGSCPFFKERKVITFAVNKLTYEEVKEKYGNKLVLVASQKLREKAILPAANESAVELTIIQYCIVERVARARYLGECTRGKISLNVMKIDPKSLFYQRKMLLKNKIITKQAFSMKYGETRLTALVSILHIPKFYTSVETVLCKTLKKIFAYLKECRDFREEAAKMRNLFGKHMIRTITQKEYSEIFDQITVTHSEYYPEAFAAEKNPVRIETLSRKTVKLIALKDPNFNLVNFFRLKAEEKEETDDSNVPEYVHFAPNLCSSQTTLNYLVHCHIINSGPRGATLREISEKLSITALEARSACRVLIRNKVACTVLEDVKKTKVNRYVWFKYKNSNVIYQELGSQAEKDFPPPLLLEPEMTGPPPEELTFWTLVDGTLQPQVISHEPTSSSSDNEPPIPTRGPDFPIIKLEAIEPGIHQHRPRNLSPSHSIAESSELGGYTHTVSIPDSSIGVHAEDFEGIEEDEDVHDFTQSIRFSKGESTDFIKKEGADNVSFSFDTPSGWTVLLDSADLKVNLGKRSTFNSMKSLDRGNIILNMIYKNTLILGIQEILRAIRKREASTKKGDVLDRRTLYRLLKQLQMDSKIQMWRITVSNEHHRRVCSAFTPGDISQSNPLLLKAVDSLIQTVVGRVKLTKEEKRQRQKKSSILKRTVHPQRQPIPIKTKTRVKAKPGSKKNRNRSVLNRTRIRVSRARLTPRIKKPVKRGGHDEVDRQALSLMQGQRGDWNQEEDRHLLCLFISSVLFVPRYNFEKVFIFNAPQIRDILRARLKESCSKTQTAIRRRIHFLMKSKKFYERYRFYLNLAMHDPVLRTEILPKYEDTGKIFNEIPTEALIKVFDYLMNVFTNSSPPKQEPVEHISSECIPDDEDFKSEEFGDDESAEGYLCYEFFEDSEQEIVGQTQGHELVPINYEGFSVVRQPNRAVVIVDGKDDPTDKHSVDIWTARTVLLSLILSGDKSSDVTSFLNCVSDDVLDFVVQNLRSLNLTTVTKPNSRFTITASMKRKLQCHLTVPIFRKCFQVLLQLRSEKTFDCTQEMSLPTLFLIADFLAKPSLQMKIEMPESVITVNEEWQDLFASLSSKDFDLVPKKKRKKPNVTKKEISVSEESPDKLPPGRKRKKQDDFTMETLKRGRIDAQHNSRRLPELTITSINLKMEAHLVPRFHDEREEEELNSNQQRQGNPGVSAVATSSRLDPARVNIKSKAITVDDILSTNEIFKTKPSKVRYEEADSNDSGTWQTLVLGSDSFSPQRKNLVVGITETSVRHFQSVSASTDTSREVEFGNRSALEDELEDGEDEDLDDDFSADYVPSDPDSADSDDDHTLVESPLTRKSIAKNNAKVAESLRKTLMKLPEATKEKRVKSSEGPQNDPKRNEPMSVKRGQISNKTLRALRTKINATQAESNLIEKDFFSVNLPKITVSYGDKIDETIYGTTQERSEIVYLQKLLMKLVPADYIKSILNPDIPDGLGRFTIVYEMIEICEEVGISIPFLLKKFERSFLSSALDYLVNGNYIFMVGVQNRRYVATCHCQSWTMPVPTGKGFHTERVILRPWITSTGCLNWPMITQMFSTLIGWMNIIPSLRVIHLCQKMHPMLSSVESMILIEALEHLGFVKFYTLETSHETTLFSEPSNLKKKTVANGFLDMETLCVELKPYATAKFSDLEAVMHSVPKGNVFPDVLGD